MEATQASPADLVLAELESQSMVQRRQTAEQDYLDAITQLRRQLGIPELARSITPAGALHLPWGPEPADEEFLIGTALKHHPLIHAAESRVEASRAAVCLARADRIPVASVGPVYESDETGTTFYGLAVSSPVHVLNSGKPLVYQREVEYRRDVTELNQLRNRITAEVQASLAKWSRTQALVDEVVASTRAIQSQNERMEQLFAAGQTDLLRLLQAR